MVKSLTIITTCDYGNRYVTSFVNELSKLESDIIIQRYRGREANAKSIIGVLSLSIMAGEEIEVYVLGKNEEIVLSDYEKVKEILG